MAHLRKKGKNYYAEFYNPERSPVRKWVALRTTDKSAATVKMVDLDRQHAHNDFDPWTSKTSKKLTMDQAGVRFVNSRSHCVAQTVEHYQVVLSLFGRSVGVGIQIDRVSQQDVKDFLARPGWSNATVRNYHRHIRAFFKWATEEGLVKLNPVDGIKLSKEQKKVPAFMTRHQLEQLLNTVRDDYSANRYRGADKQLWLADVIEFACYTGLRRSEVCRLRWQDVDLESGHVTVRNTADGTTKSGSERRVPIVGPALGIVELLKEDLVPDDRAYVFSSGHGKPLAGDYLSKRFRHFRRMAGLAEDLCFHSCRHTCASWLVINGVSLYVVKEILGHSSIEVTQRYAHLAPDSMHQEMQRALG